MKFYYALFFLCISLLLSACSPHPAAGVWKATKDNSYGISRLVVGFDGRADFVTAKQNNATWHCFWSMSGKQEAKLDCTSSLNTDQEERFVLSINEQGLAQLHHKSQLAGTFTRLNENPSPRK
jgi:outer membrane biogenesis lipoprotein LolB